MQVIFNFRFAYHKIIERVPHAARALWSASLSGVIPVAKTRPAIIHAHPSVIAHAEERWEPLLPAVYLQVSVYEMGRQKLGIAA